jgi:ABC-type branched-subunit amino acid transport system substrate-binding protein
MALFDVADGNFALLPIDTKGTPKGAAAAANEAIAAGAQLIIGPLYAGSVATAAPIARAGDVPIIALSNDRTVAGDGVYIMGFMPSNHIERVVAFARSRGAKRFAALAPDTDYGRTMVTELRRAAASSGGLLSRVEYYDPEASDVSAAVRRLADYDRRRQALVRAKRELKGVDEEWSRRELERLELLDTLGEVEYDAVLLPEGGERLRAIAPLLPFYDADSGGARLIGTGQWDDPTIGHEPALVGGWFAAPPPASHARFERRYQKLYGQTPIRIASLGYDAVALAARLAQSTGGPDFSDATLTSPFGFLGADGLFRFHSDGLVERSLAILEVRQRDFLVVSPARQKFAVPASAN